MKSTKRKKQTDSFSVDDTAHWAERLTMPPLVIYCLLQKVPASLPPVKAHTKYINSALWGSQHHFFSSCTPGGDCWMNKQITSFVSRWLEIQNIFSKGSHVIRVWVSWTCPQSWINLSHHWKATYFQEEIKGKRSTVPKLIHKNNLNKKCWLGQTLHLLPSSTHAQDEGGPPLS